VASDNTGGAPCQAVLDTAVWEDEAALQAFVTAPPHAAVMKALAPHMGATRFTRRIVKSPELPLRWDDALKRSDPAE
jgi:hypothetical protein